MQQLDQMEHQKPNYITKLFLSSSVEMKDELEEVSKFEIEID